MSFQRFLLYWLISFWANTAYADIANTTPHSESSAPSIKIGVHNMGEPLAYLHEGEASGIFPDLIQAIGSASGVELDIQLLPYQRIFTQATWQQQDLGLTFQPNKESVAEIPLTLSCFKNSLFRTRLNIYGIKKSEKDQPIMASLVPSQLNKSEHLLAAIGGKSLEVIERTSVEALFKSLLSSRVDYIASSELATYYWIQKLQAPPIRAFARLADVEGVLCHPKQRVTTENINRIKYYMESISNEEFSKIASSVLNANNIPDSFLESFLPSFNIGH